MADINIGEVLEKPAFSCLEAETREQYVKIFEKIQGKNMAESAMIIMDAVKKMPKSKDINKEEQKAMLDALLESVSDGDRAKYQKIAKMFM